MPGTSKVALASTMFDPEARMAGALSDSLRLLGQIYADMFVAVSRGTSEASLDLDKSSGAHVWATRPGMTGQSRREALSPALDAGYQVVHYCDLDRVLHWVAKYPDELRQTVKTVRRDGYTILGRTKRAMDTHPAAQLLTETLTNKIASLLLGKQVDVAAGSCGVSRRAGLLVLEHSRAPTNATDAEWPMIVHSLCPDELGYVEVEGLEFETTDYYQDEIRRAGSAEAWIAERYETPLQWRQRVELALASIEALVEAKRLCSEPAAGQTAPAQRGGKRRASDNHG